MWIFLKSEKLITGWHLFLSDVWNEPLRKFLILLLSALQNNVQSNEVGLRTERIISKDQLMQFSCRCLSNTNTPDTSSSKGINLHFIVTSQKQYLKLKSHLEFEMMIDVDVDQTINVGISVIHVFQFVKDFMLYLSSISNNIFDFFTKNQTNIDIHLQTLSILYLKS